MNIVRENSTLVDGYPAWKMEYMDTDYNQEIFVLAGNQVYTIKIQTPELRAPETLPVFEKIMNSIEIAEN